VARIGTGSVRDGALSASAEPGAVWGLLIDGLPVVAFPVSSDGEVVDLGEILILAEGLPWPAFHAKDGRVYGIARAAREATAAPAPVVPQPPGVAGEAIGAGPAPVLRTRMTFGEMFGSTARQLASAADTLQTRFVLSDATVRLKGVPSAGQDALSLEFPSADVAATAVGLSEVAFSIRASREAVAPAPAPVAGASVPQLVGYTRELALRKAATAGFVAELSHELTANAGDEGRVVRQLPGAASLSTPGGLIRLYIGKRGVS
jgi:hypothetical protein